MLQFFLAPAFDSSFRNFPQYPRYPQHDCCD